LGWLSLCPNLGVDIANKAKRQRRGTGQNVLLSRESYLVKQTGRGPLLPPPGEVSLPPSMLQQNTGHREAGAGVGKQLQTAWITL